MSWCLWEGAHLCSLPWSYFWSLFLSLPLSYFLLLSWSSSLIIIFANLKVICSVLTLFIYLIMLQVIYPVIFLINILFTILYIYIYRSVFQMEQPHGRRCYSLTKGELDSSPAPNKGAKGKRIYNTSIRSSCATPWTPTQSSQVFRALPHRWH